MLDLRPSFLAVKQIGTKLQFDCYFYSWSITMDSFIWILGLRKLFFSEYKTLDDLRLRSPTVSRYGHKKFSFKEGKTLDDLRLPTVSRYNKKRLQLCALPVVLAMHEYKF